MYPLQCSRLINLLCIKLLLPRAAAMRKRALVWIRRSCIRGLIRFLYRRVWLDIVIFWSFRMNDDVDDDEWNVDLGNRIYHHTCNLDYLNFARV
jgi:hypothetical protein